MALTPAQIANAVVRDCHRQRIANYEIRQRRSELVGRWLRSTSWFLSKYPTLEAQATLYKEVEKNLFRLTVPKKSKRKSRKKNTRQLFLDL